MLVPEISRLSKIALIAFLEQRWTRRVCSYAQTRLVLRCSKAQFMDADEGQDQTLAL